MRGALPTLYACLRISGRDGRPEASRTVGSQGMKAPRALFARRCRTSADLFPVTIRKHG